MTRPMRTAALLAALSLVAGCSSGKHKALPPSPSPTTESPSPTPSPTPTMATALTSPLTGLPVDRLRPMLAVKIDNAPLARPQRGLDQADIVFEEEVEGHTTRFLAIFSSKVAGDIGPVRSVRESDLPLLREFGSVAFGFSGGNRGVLATVRANPVYDVSYDRYPGAYTVAGRRRDAFNFITSSDRLLALAPKAVVAHDVGLRFGDLPAAYTRPGPAVTVPWGRARTAWKYDPTHNVYLRWMDGAKAMLRNGLQQRSPNVLIQYVTVRGSRYSDVHGSPSPYTTTIGSGRAMLLRDGKCVIGTWSRAGLGPTTFRDGSGRPMLLHPGPVWIMLVRSSIGTPLR